MNASGPSLQIRLSNYARTRSVLEKVASSRLYRGAFATTLKAMLDIAKRYAERVTHVMTGTLRASHVVEYSGHHMRGSLHIDQRALARAYNGATRPGVEFVWQYAVIEHARGGSHAFYERTVKETGGILLMDGITTMVRNLDSELR